MQIAFLAPRPELQAYIRSLWVLESEHGMPARDGSLAAPNGSPKLIIPCENSLDSIAGGRVQVSRERGLYFVGNRDSSTLIHSSARRTTFIVIEFTPQGAYPFFGVPMSETLNQHLDAGTLLGPAGSRLTEQIHALPDTASMISFIEDELLRRLSQGHTDSRLIDFCVQRFTRTDGRLSIGELARETGCSRQYLDRVFKRHVGLPPKALAVILRFQRFYRHWAERRPYEQIRDELLDFYSDQSHFIREFRRMTGHPPLRFLREVPNEFGRRVTLG
jgi:AraC-like DNA-binding protein